MLKIDSIKRRVASLVKFAADQPQVQQTQTAGNDNGAASEPVTELGPAAGMAPFSGWLPIMKYAPLPFIAGYEGYINSPLVGNAYNKFRAAKAFDDSFIKTPIATATKDFASAPGGRHPVDLSNRRVINDDNLREAFLDLSSNPDTFWNASPVGDIKRMHHQAVIMQAMLDNPSRFRLTGDAGSVFRDGISDRTRRTIGQLAFGENETFVPRGSVFPESAGAGGFDIPEQDFWRIVRNPNTAQYNPSGARPHPLVDKRRDLNAAVQEVRSAIGKDVPQIGQSGDNVVITRPSTRDTSRARREYVKANTNPNARRPRGRAASWLELVGLLSSLYGIGGEMWNNRSGTTSTEHVDYDPVVEEQND